MRNPMDNANFHNVENVQPDIQTLIQQARQNPQAFEEQFKRQNPQAYQQALQIRNSPNPQALIRQMAQAKGINPNILRMLGL